MGAHAQEWGIDLMLSGIKRRFLASRRKLVILDDIFPLLISGFRLAEYNAYLSHFSGAEVHSSGSAFPIVGEHRNFEDVKADYALRFPKLASRVRRLAPDRKILADFAYTVFIHNMLAFTPWLEKANVPFAFTLYPGAGFAIDQLESDEQLRRVFSSPQFRKVVVTQTITRNYLVDKNLCPLDMIEFIYGVVCQTLLPARRYYGIDKEHFDICFVAHKYKGRGEGKGYDIFVDVAHLLSRAIPKVRFHVVGGFSAADIDVSALEGQIIFYGTREPAFFQGFYVDMDMILSPTRPFVTSLRISMDFQLAHAPRLAWLEFRCSVRIR
jgi:glycosyltransferase involved in cell wall biosynthesis